MDICCIVWAFLDIKAPLVYKIKRGNELRVSIYDIKVFSLCFTHFKHFFK